MNVTDVLLSGSVMVNCKHEKDDFFSNNILQVSKTIESAFDFSLAGS